ncbi:unnamed protein product [Urochloa decumbens]|uniref:F-box domain-containing protein n=1 Tax=Urochloa decumbens TaxID=240449 RepID=A0ABC9BW49_9POAL
MEAGGDAEPAQALLARDWSELALDALTSIFTKLGAVEVLMGAGLVCHSWLFAAKVPSLWRYLNMTKDNNVVKEMCSSGARDLLCAMAKEVVDRSGGQLEVFIGEEFVDDDLIKYIGGRTPSLKILHLTSCFTVLNEGFVEAINRFPLLEELKLSACENIGGRATYEAVGKACRNLKRFEVAKYMPLPYSFEIDQEDNSDCDAARGIATMRGLHSLKISHSKLNNKALAAILDNCPHLESLDLDYCFNIFMDDAMRAKYAGIKMELVPDLDQTLSLAMNQL